MMEKLFFKNSKGNRLCGILSKPSYAKEKIVILCHGFSSSKDSRTNVELEKIFNAHGLATFRFDFYGHGESEGKFEEVTLSEAAHDIERAFSFLQKRGFREISLVGSSFGGAAAVLTASRTAIRALALKSPVFDYKKKTVVQKGKQFVQQWKKEGYVDYDSGHLGRKLKIGYSFFDDFGNYDLFKVSRHIRVPVIIVHGDNDDVVPVEQSIAAAKSFLDCRLEILKGVNHDYVGEKDFNTMVHLLSSFILAHA